MPVSRLQGEVGGFLVQGEGEVLVLHGEGLIRGGIALDVRLEAVDLIGGIEEGDDDLRYAQHQSQDDHQAKHDAQDNASLHCGNLLS